MYGVTPARTQVHSGIKLRPPFRVVWSRNLHGLLEFPAVVWNGVAYVNNIHGTLTALSMSTGRVLWSKRLGTLAASSPAVDAKRGVLVVTTMSPGNVNVISMKTGHVRWRYATGRAEPSPVIRDGVAYFAATNGSVYALDLDRRRPREADAFSGGSGWAPTSTHRRPSSGTASTSERMPASSTAPTHGRAASSGADLRGVVFQAESRSSRGSCTRRVSKTA